MFGNRRSFFDKVSVGIIDKILFGVFVITISLAIKRKKLDHRMYVHGLALQKLIGFFLLINK